MHIFYVKAKCMTEIGDNKGYHYFEVSNEGLTADMTQVCPAHSSASVTDRRIRFIDDGT